MLEHLPSWLGKALDGVRAGADKLSIARPELAAQGAAIDLSSPAFADGARLPDRFTADGAGVSPPLVWGKVPDGTALLALIVEDADAPTPQPLVHGVVWGLSAETSNLAEGAIAPDAAGTPDKDVGRNSYFREGWLPPDPPTGHGEHRYAFQLFALDAGCAPLHDTPGRSSVIEAMAGHVLAVGILIGTYSREEPAPTGLVGAVSNV